MKTQQKQIIILVLILVSIGLLIIFNNWYKKYTEEQTVNKLLETYNLLSDGYNLMIKEKSKELKWTKDYMNTEKLVNVFAPYLPVKKDCSYFEPQNCFPKKVKFKHPYNNSIDSTFQNFYKLKLKNGVSLAVIVLSPDCSYVRGRCATIFVDVNGTKGPNKLGSDVFDFGIFKDKLIPYEAEIVHQAFCIDGLGDGCAAYVLKYKDLNYENYYKYQNRAAKIKQEHAKIKDKRK